MFGGLGVVFLALLILPVLGGIAAGMLFLSIPRLRFLAAYSALLPLFGLLGLFGGFIGGCDYRGLTYTDTTMGFRQLSGLRGHSPSR